MKQRLTVVHKFFPKVTKVVNAKEHVEVEVSPHDASTSKRSKHSECAMAVACKREFKLDGVIIARSIAYLVRGKTATRFGVPMSLSREVTAFDRGAGFAPGVYSLVKPSQYHSGGKNKERTGTGKKMTYRHLTTGIRAVLGGKDAQV